MPAPLGNRNAAKENRIWGDELRKAVAQDSRAKIRRAIEKQLDAAAEGDLQASKELADRLDGKPTMLVESHVTHRHVTELPDDVLERVIATGSSNGIAKAEESPPDADSVH